MSEYQSMVRSAQERSITRGTDRMNEMVIATKQMEPVVAELKNEVKKMRKSKKMPYDVYVDNYLLLHMGFESKTDRYTIEDWLSFAGADEEIMEAVPGYEFTQRGMYSAVDLVDSLGRVVATVPPMYPVESFLLHNAENDEADVNRTISGQLDSIRRHGENYREQGSRMRDDFFMALADRFSPQLIEAHRQAWRNFFVRMKVMNPDGTLVVTADEEGNILVNKQRVNENKTAIAAAAAAPAATAAAGSTVNGINSEELDGLFF